MSDKVLFDRCFLLSLPWTCYLCYMLHCLIWAHIHSVFHYVLSSFLSLSLSLSLSLHLIQMIIWCCKYWWWWLLINVGIPALLPWVCEERSIEGLKIGCCLKFLFSKYCGYWYHIKALVISHQTERITTSIRLIWYEHHLI